ncbi:MAG TPA: quaternary ammonium transporter, partial [Anaerolineaceae bacterium]|nr:quaternary ammonium transporter [Anaerolineaceae bacterium]
KILNDFAALLTDDIMSGLNWQVDGPEGKEPADVARAFLLEKGLVK